MLYFLFSHFHNFLLKFVVGATTCAATRYAVIFYIRTFFFQAAVRVQVSQYISGVRNRHSERCCIVSLFLREVRNPSKVFLKYMKAWCMFCHTKFEEHYFLLYFFLLVQTGNFFFRRDISVLCYNMCKITINIILLVLFFGLMD